MKRVIAIWTIILCCNSILIAQNVTLFEQFNGRYDYLAIGNTLNPAENNLNQAFCSILDSSSADLMLTSDQTLIKAYLYWAGSGDADVQVSLNNTTITADDTYNVGFSTLNNFGQPITLNYFSCYSDITSLISSNGNGLYTFADLDISSALAAEPEYCDNRTNFGGWSIYVIYQDSSLPLNQVSLFQGLEIINRNIQVLDIELTSINVFDNIGAKIGFLAWEGDNALNFGESLSINGNIISNPPLNFPDNAFNGTNSFTNTTNFYNMDLDVYNIENNIAIGDTSATIQLTTGDFDIFGNFQADLIIINNIITVLNSRLPDATLSLDNFSIDCDNASIDIDFTVFNTNSTDSIPANTPIAFYADGLLIAQSETQNIIPIGSSEMGTINITNFGNAITDITIVAVVDDEGNGVGTLDETNETNNISSISIPFVLNTDIIELPGLVACNEGLGLATYNLMDVFETSDLDMSNISFYTSIEEAQQNVNPILELENFQIQTPISIYLRVITPPCVQLYQFELLTENCPPTIPQGFSPNNDNYNDWFNIQGLYDIFLNHELKIFNRHGVLLFEGNNDLPWDGTINKGLNAHGKIVPVGTYYYILFLNDSVYHRLSGWVYVNY